ncbi:MAG: GNAT family protein [Dehalococcoidia bacterium]
MLEGKLVRLRSLEPSDVEREYAWANDLEVTHYLSMRYPFSRADEESWLRGGPPNSFNQVRLGIETKAGLHIGNIGLYTANAEERHAELWILIGDKAYWSKGYGADAIVTLLRFAFHDMNLNRVYLYAQEANARAIACYRTCGFVEEGRLRQHRFRHGRYWDVLFMGVLRDEFDALHGGPS